MGSSRLRVGLVVAAAATMVLGVLAVPSTAQAVVIKPTGLAPNDPSAAPTSTVPGSPIKNVVLSWSTVTGATGYQVQVSDEFGNFANPSIDATTTVPRFAPSSKLYHADYAWRVRATGGTWSDLAYFTRGWAASPANPTVVENDASTGPVLTWDGLPDASFYEVQLSPRPFVRGTDPVDGGDGGENGGDIMSCFTASNVFTPYTSRSGDDAGIVAGTTVKCTEIVGGFYWRVRGRDGVLDPATINLKAPAQDCVGVYYAKSAAKTVGSAECSAWGYPDASTPDFYAATQIGNFTPGKVTGLDIGPRDGLMSPNVVVTSTPTFSWTPVTGASFYRVIVTRDNGTTTWNHVWETTAPAIAPVIQDPDSPNVRTTWRVVACVVTSTDSKGFVLNYQGDTTIGIQCGLSSDESVYRKITPPDVVQTSTVTEVPGGHTFSWSTATDFSRPNGGAAVRVSDVQGYALQFSDNYGSFEHLAKVVLVDRQGNTPGKSSATVPDLPTGFKWRVCGIDSSNNVMPCSEAPDVIGTLASAKATVTTKSLPALRTPIDFRFNAPVDGVQNGTARIITDNDSTSFPGVISEVNDVTYRFTPSANWVAGERYRLLLTTAVKTASTNVPAVGDNTYIRAFTRVDSASAALSKVTGDFAWTTAKASDAQGGSYLRSDDRRSTTKRSYVQTRVRGSKVTVYACYGPSSGNAGLYVDGSLKATINLYKTYSRCGTVYSYPLNSNAQHTVRFAPLGTKVKAAKSTQVRFDGFAVS